MLRENRFDLEANSYVFVVVAIAVPKPLFAPVTTAIIRVVVAMSVEMTAMMTAMLAEFTVLAANLDDFGITGLKY